MATVHEMTPSLGPLEPLLRSLARFLGLAGDRHADDAFDNPVPDAGGYATGDRDHVRKFLGSLANKGLGLLDSHGDLLIDAGELAEASSGPRGLMELLVTRVLDELGPLPPPRSRAKTHPVAPMSATARHPDQEIAVNLTPESPEAYANRVNAEHMASDRLADEARAQNDAYYARRGRSAESHATPAEPSLWSMPYGGAAAAPLTPSVQEEVGFLAGLAKARGSNRAAADAIRSACEALPVRAASLASTFRTGWLGHVCPMGEPMARWMAMARAMESAGDGAIRYDPPTPEEVRTAVLRLITGAALANRIAPVKLLADVEAGTASLAAAEARVEAEQDRHLRGAGSAAGDLESLRQRYHHARAPLAGMGGVKDAFVELQVILPKALARAVSRALEAAGGRASVVADLADLLLIQGTTSSPDPDEEELAAVQGQLKAIGSSTGRAATALVARRDELATALEARRTAARETATSRAERDVSAALAGDPEGVEALAAVVVARPDAFADGLSKALKEVGPAALAAIKF